MNQYKNEFSTPNFPLATSLICLGFPLITTLRGIDGKTHFIFDRTDEIDKTLEFFWQKKLLIEPNAFWESQRFLKSILYSKDIDAK